MPSTNIYPHGKLKQDLSLKPERIINTELIILPQKGVTLEGSRNFM